MSYEMEQLLMERRNNPGCPGSGGYVQFIPFKVDIPSPPTLSVTPRMLGMPMGMEQVFALCLLSFHQWNLWTLDPARLYTS